jgi:hypothetical protein
MAYEGAPRLGLEENIMEVGPSWAFWLSLRARKEMVLRPNLVRRLPGK